MGDQTEVAFDWSALAAVIAGFSGLAETIRAQHQPDATGHCTLCRQEQQGCAQVHPCRLHDVAGMAIELRGGTR